MSAGLLPGSLFARDFKVVRRLGEGGMGEVYVAEQISTGAMRALKLMHPVLVRNEKFVRRFEQEARVGARIKSDHVVQVLAAGVDEFTRMPWIAMELLEGETLLNLVETRGYLSIVETQEVVAQLCHALAAAHAIGVVHRDLKPENIFLAHPRRGGIPFTVKLLDFGIARVIAEAATSRNDALGTLVWMAPEQTMPGQEIAATADVWSLGLLVFWMVTGLSYWKGANREPRAAPVILREIVMEPLVPASVRAQELGVGNRIPPGFDSWFEQCVSRDTNSRFADAAAAKVALMHVLFEAGGMPPEMDAGFISRASLVSPIAFRAQPPADGSGGGTPRSVRIDPTQDDLSQPSSETSCGAVLPVSGRRGSLRPSRRMLRWVVAVAVFMIPAWACLWLWANRVFRSQACSAGNSDSCQKLCETRLLGRRDACLRAAGLFASAAMASESTSTARVRARVNAAESYKTACERYNDWSGCTHAGLIRQQGILQDPRWQRNDVAASDLFRRACRQSTGDIPGCILYGAALRMGTGTGRNADNEDAYSQEAARYFQLACDASRGGQGCYWLGYLAQYGGGGIPKNPVAAEAYYRAGCNGGHGNAEACEQLAQFYEHGHFTPREEFFNEHDQVYPRQHAESMDRYGQALRLWNQQCIGGNPESCMREGLLFWKGKGESPAPEKAASRFLVACEVGYAPACMRLLALCSEAAARKVKPTSSITCDKPLLAQLACQGRLAEGCVNLGELTVGEKDSQEAFRRAETLWLESCDGGYGHSCLELGKLYAQGKPGIARNDGRAVAYFDRACDREEAEGCKQLGDLYRTGDRLVEKNAATALQHYRKACELIHASACYDAAIMLRTEQASGSTPTEPTDLLTQACDLRMAEGCYELGRAFERGEGVPRDLRRAQKYHSRACESSEGATHTGACLALGMLLRKEASAVDKAKGHSLLVAACDTGKNAEACYQVGLDLAEGQGTGRDSARAGEYLGQACRLGYKPACVPGR